MVRFLVVIIANFPQHNCLKQSIADRAYHRCVNIFPGTEKIWSRATSRLQRNHAKLQSFIFSTEQFLETELSNDKFLECFCRISIIFLKQNRELVQDD